MKKKKEAIKINKMKNKKSQAWGIDLMVGIVIFSLVIVFFYFYALNQPGEAKETIETLLYEGKIISNLILSNGYPEDWNSGNVQKIGILNNNKINQTKLESFYDMVQTNEDYTQTKIKFTTKYNYYFFLDKSMIINGEGVEGIGKPGATKANIPSSAKNLIKITRFTIYSGEPTTAYLYIWN